MVARCWGVALQGHDAENGSLVPAGTENGVTAELTNTILAMMSPIMESIGALLKNNTEAIQQIASCQEQMAAGQDAMRIRMEALEKQVRLSTPVTDRQVKYLQEAARTKARELLDKKGFGDDKKAISKLSGVIKKSVMARFGGSLREIPKVEYNVAMNQVETWNNVIAVMDIVKEARKRQENNKSNSITD